jgi:hypothetical protein
MKREEISKGGREGGGEGREGLEGEREGPPARGGREGGKEVRRGRHQLAFFPLGNPVPHFFPFRTLLPRLIPNFDVAH